MMRTVPEHSTLKGAQALAERLTAFWAARGKKVTISTYCVLDYNRDKHAGTGGSIFGLRSNIDPYWLTGTDWLPRRGTDTTRDQLSKDAISAGRLAALARRYTT